MRTAILLTASFSLLVAGTALVQAARVSRQPTELTRLANNASEGSSGQQPGDKTALVLWLPSDLDESSKSAATAHPLIPAAPKHRRAHSSESAPAQRSSDGGSRSF